MSRSFLSAGAAVCLIVLFSAGCGPERSSEPDPAQTASSLSANSAPAIPHAVLVSPRDPRPGGPVRVLAAFESDASKVSVSLRGPDGPIDPASLKRGGGPPYWIAAEFAAAPSADPVVIFRAGRK